MSPFSAYAQPRARGSLPDGSPFLGGIPTLAPRPAEPLQLSLQDAVRRALDHNLGAIVAEERLASAAGARTHAFGDLLPERHGGACPKRVGRRTSRRSASRCARSFRGSSVPSTCSTRASSSRRRSSMESRQRCQRRRARAHGDPSRLPRGELVVLVSGNLICRRSSRRRAESARAQRETADALHRQAVNLRQSGLVAGIDVVRAEVRLATERQRATAAENEFRKRSCSWRARSGCRRASRSCSPTPFPIAPRR